MKVCGIVYGSFAVLNVLLLVLDRSGTAVAQEPAFELPVELIGFPVIIIAVRLSNFVKKLAYSLNPKTYSPRARRSIVEGDDLIDMMEAEKRLVAQLGDNVCIYTRVCLHHAEKASKNRVKDRFQIDWDDIFSQYKTSKEKQKEFYLLSVFLGDIVGSTRFCNQLAKRGRSCAE